MASAKLSAAQQPAGSQLSADRPLGTTPTGRPRAGEAVTWLLLATLAIAVLDHGGYYATAQRMLGIALLAAVATVVVAGWPAISRPPSAAGWTTPAVAGSAYAGWAFLDGVLHGNPASGIRPALLVAAAGAVIGLCRCLDPGLRVRLLEAVLWLGCLTGLLGWYGVAGHSPAFALTGQGLWRAMGTLSYPNAAAALLAMLAVAAAFRQAELARREPAQPHWPAALASTVLLVGLGATLSRGGMLAVAAGFAVLAALLGPRRVLATLCAPALGAALALAGLLPGLADTAAPRLGTAAGMLAVGLAVGTWAPAGLRLLRSRTAGPGFAGRLAALAGLAVLAALSLGAAAVLSTGRPVLHELRQARFTLSSTDRAAAWQAGAEAIGRHPVIGAGPGPHTFTWPDPHGGVLVFRYLHDEYLQVLAELGAVGLVLLALCLAAVFRVLLRHRPRSAGGGAAIAVLAVAGTSALFDFTGHFPAIVLTAAALVGCAEPGSPAAR